MDESSVASSPTAASEGSFSATMGSFAPDAREAPVLLGPTRCVIERAKDRYRFHFMCKSPVGYHISDCISAALAAVGPKQGISVSVDVDAYDLM